MQIENFPFHFTEKYQTKTEWKKGKSKKKREKRKKYSLSLEELLCCREREKKGGKEKKNIKKKESMEVERKTKSTSCDKIMKKKEIFK